MGVAAGGGWSMVETIQGHGHPIGGETTGRLDFSDVSFLDELIRDVDYITWESFSASPWPDMERSFVYGRVRGFMDAMTMVKGKDRVHAVSPSRGWHKNEWYVWLNRHDVPSSDALLAWCGWADVFEPRLFALQDASLNQSKADDARPWY